MDKACVGKRYLALAVTFSVLAASAPARDDWVVFKGQVNGPVARPGGIDPDTFKFKNYPGKYLDEGYYHEMYFPDGTWVTMAYFFNRKEANGSIVVAKSGQEPFKDYFTVDLEELKLDQEGVGFSIGRDNRMRLSGNQYTVDFKTENADVKFTFDILGPSYVFGDCMVKFPDQETFFCYTFPITWARVRLQGVIGGKKYDLTGYGNMNHDGGEMWLPDNPPTWQHLRIYEQDFLFVVHDFINQPKFDEKKIQRLIFVDRQGHMFTSTSYSLKWDDWTRPRMKDISFRYPRHYVLKAEGGGEQLEVEFRAGDEIVLEDLFSNLSVSYRLFAMLLANNLWTVDNWAEYTLTYHHDGQADVYKGKGIITWISWEDD